MPRRPAGAAVVRVACGRLSRPATGQAALPSLRSDAGVASMPAVHHIVAMRPVPKQQRCTELSCRGAFKDDVRWLSLFKPRRQSSRCFGMGRRIQLPGSVHNSQLGSSLATACEPWPVCSRPQKHAQSARAVCTHAVLTQVAERWTCNSGQRCAVIKPHSMCRLSRSCCRGACACAARLPFDRRCGCARCPADPIPSILAPCQV